MPPRIDTRSSGHLHSRVAALLTLVIDTIVEIISGRVSSISEYAIRKRFPPRCVGFSSSLESVNGVGMLVGLRELEEFFFYRNCNKFHRLRKNFYASRRITRITILLRNINTVFKK